MGEESLEDSPKFGGGSSFSQGWVGLKRNETKQPPSAPAGASRIWWQVLELLIPSRLVGWLVGWLENDGLNVAWREWVGWFLEHNVLVRKVLWIYGDWLWSIIKYECNRFILRLCKFWKVCSNVLGECFLNITWNGYQYLPFMKTHSQITSFLFWGGSRSLHNSCMTSIARLMGLIPLKILTISGLFPRLARTSRSQRVDLNEILLVFFFWGDAIEDHVLTQQILALL